jgi:hypothetical protein
MFIQGERDFRWKRRGHLSGQRHFGNGFRDSGNCPLGETRHCNGPPNSVPGSGAKDRRPMNAQVGFVRLRETADGQRGR